jgi:hypothetical protein
LISRPEHFTDINRIIIFWDISGNIFLLDLLGYVSSTNPEVGSLRGGEWGVVSMVLTNDWGKYGRNR